MHYSNESETSEYSNVNEEEASKPSGSLRSSADVRRIECEDLLRDNGFLDIELIGKGSFGFVFKATDKDGKVVAVKVPQSIHNNYCRLFTNTKIPRGTEPSCLENLAS
jgi:serine/threonine protein kinase